MTSPGGAEPWVPREPTLRSLQETIDECRGCELWERATQAVMGSGDPGSTLMLIGEAPGDHEDVEGLPFVGPAGHLLDKALVAAGIDAGTTYRTNAVKHFRFTGERGKRRIHQSPARRHVVACKPWIEAEIDVVAPAGVVLLGATAGQAIFGAGFRISDSRGTLLEWPQSPRSARPFLLATAHPSAVLRSRHRDEDFERLVDDLRLARSELGSSA